MRIAILMGYGLRGSGSTIYTYDLCQALARMGHSIHLLCHEYKLENLAAVATPISATQNHSIFQDAELPDLRYHTFRRDKVPVAYPRLEMPAGVALATMEPSSMDSYVADIKNWLEDLHRSNDFDLILVNHLSLMAEATASFSAESGIPFRILVHGTGLHYGVEASDTVRMRVAEAVVAAEEVICQNQAARDRVARSLPLRDNQVRLIAPGTDTQLFSFRVPRPSPAQIAYVGRLTLDKGIHLLLAAMPLIHRDHPGISLALAGEGPDGDALANAWICLQNGDVEGFVRTCAQASCDHHTRARASERVGPLLSFLRQVDAKEYAHCLEQLPAIHWLGSLDRPQVASLFHASAVSVLPSLAPESYPLSICEALACGTPSVGPNIAGVGHILGNIEANVPELAGRLLYDAAPDRAGIGLVKQISSLLGDYPRTQIRSQVRTFVESHHAWRNAAFEVTTQSMACSSQTPNPLHDRFF